MAKRLKGVPNLPFAPIVGALFGLVAAILVFATPAWLLERTVTKLGISSMIAAAQPPLGDTARTLIAIAAGLFTGFVLWLLMRPVEKMIHKGRSSKMGPVKAADATEVPASAEDRLARRGRAPIFAERELGAPLMSDEALASGEEFLLDQPAAAAPIAYSEYSEPSFGDEPDLSRLGEAGGARKPVLDLGWPEDEPGFEATAPTAPVVEEEPIRLEPPVGWDSPASSVASAPEQAQEEVFDLSAYRAPEAEAQPLPWYERMERQIAPAPATPEVDVTTPEASPADPEVEVVPTAVELGWPQPETAPMTQAESPVPAWDQPVVFETMEDDEADSAVFDGQTQSQPEEQPEPWFEPEPEFVPHQLAGPVEDELSWNHSLEAELKPEPDLAFESDAEESASVHVPVQTDFAAAAPVPSPAIATAEEEQADLRALLDRLETALDRRAETAAPASPPMPGTVASLRELIEGGRKSVA